MVFSARPLRIGGRVANPPRYIDVLAGGGLPGGGRPAFVGRGCSDYGTAATGAGAAQRPASAGRAWGADIPRPDRYATTKTRVPSDRLPCRRLFLVSAC